MFFLRLAGLFTALLLISQSSAVFAREQPSAGDAEQSPAQEVPAVQSADQALKAEQPEPASTSAYTGATEAIKDLVETAKTYKDENESGISAEEKAARGKIKNRISGILDIREMARLILKNHWAKLKDEERKKYSELLVKMVESIGYPQIGDYFNGKIELEYTGEKELGNGDRAVLTKISYKEEDLVLASEFHMRKTPAGWRVFDVLTDGDSLLLIYRNQHMKIIKEKGFAHLVSLMQKKLDSSVKK